MCAVRIRVIGLGTTLVFALTATVAAASSIQISGTTTGCLGFDCVDPASFDSPNVVTELSTAPWEVYLGSFVRGRLNVPGSLDSPPSTLEAHAAGTDGIPNDLGLQLTLNDIENLTKNGEQALFGTITNPTYSTFDSGETGALTPVPEPASLVLLGSGLLAVARRARRNRKQG